MYSLTDAHEDGIWSCDWGVKRTMESLSDADEVDNIVEKLSDCIVTSSLDETVKIWNCNSTTSKLQLQHTLSGPVMAIISVVLNSDSTIVASSSLDTTLNIWNTSTGSKIKTISTGVVEIWTLAFSTDDKYIASGNHNGSIVAYGVESGKAERSFTTKGI